MMIVVVHTEERGDMIHVVVHSEDRGEIMIEERCDTMIMLVVPTQILTSRT